MKQYDNYKDSGIEWIGSYPKDWTLMTVRRVTDDHKQGYYSSEEYKEEGYKLVRITDLDINGNINISKSPYVSPNDKEIQIFEIRKGDMLFPRTGSIGLIGVAKEDMKAVFASYLIRFRFKAKTHNSFMRYYFMSDVFLNGLFSDLHGGVNQNIHAENIKDQHIVLPSKDEQSAIANYLDHKTTLLDTLIAKKQQFISLLQEERIAVINQAVTKGIDPKVKMKDSGIEWMGEIPEHWEVSRIKYVSEKIGSGVTPRGGAEVYETSGIPLLRSQNVYFDGFRLDNVAYITTDVHDSMNNSKVFKGDVLLNITGGSIGRCFFVTDEFEDANVNQHVCIVRPNELILTEYLYYILSSEIGQLQIDLCQTGGNREALNFEQLKKFLLALPSIEEQKIIISKIQKIKNTIDNTISKSLEEIELLKEYKTALISEVVTGKVDVRDMILN
jgi:type I restriction enzyme S subunit